VAASTVLQFSTGRVGCIAVASFAVEMLTFVVDFLVNFLEELLPTRVFFVIAIVVPPGFGFELLDAAV
jgi:hypothetical protein